MSILNILLILMDGCKQRERVKRTVYRTKAMAAVAYIYKCEKLYRKLDRGIVIKVGDMSKAARQTALDTQW